MAAMKMIAFTVCIAYCISPVWSSLFDLKTQLLWKANLAILPFIDGSFIYQVDAEPSSEGDTNSKEKLKKGRKLLIELTENLDKIKKNVEEKAEVDQETLEKVMQIKDDFTQLQLEAGDLPKKLMNNFKMKTFETFRLILQSYAVLKDEAMKIPGEIQAEPEEINKVDNQVDNEARAENHHIEGEL